MNTVNAASKMVKTTKTVSFTKYTSTSGPLSKTYELTNKKIEKAALATMYKGTAKRVSMPFDRFAEALSKATSEQAFGYGLHEQSYPNEVDIVVDKKEQSQNNILSRTKKFFNYLKLPGILMLDHDPSEYGSTLTADKLIAILIAIDPEIKSAARIIRGSVSAGVYLAGRKPKKNKGFHIYIPVKDASDIPRYGKLLFDYLWLNGHGYIALSSNGNLQVRSLIDAAVFSGERLDFVGKPIILDQGLEYREPQVKYVPGAYLDTFNLPELDDKEARKVKALITKAKKGIKSDSELKKAEYKENKIDQIMQKTGVSEEEATKLVVKIFEGKCQKLWGEWVLEFPESDVSVAEVLANPEVYNDKALADPIEGREYGKTTAKFWWNDGKPIIHSFAHGQDVSYFLSVKEPKRYIEGVDSHYRHPDYISKDEAYALMDRAAEKWIKNPKGNYAIAAPAGIGKTHIILKHVATEATKKFIEIYAISHLLANEVMDTLLGFNSNLKVVVIQGRTYVDKNVVGAVALCKKSDLIKSIERYGYNIYKDVCIDCEFFSGHKQCDYLKQFNDRTQVRIFTHSHLPLCRGALDKKHPDMAIIDERFFTVMINNHLETTLSCIERYIKNESLAELIVDSLNNKRPLLTKLRKKFGDNVNNDLEYASEQVLLKLPNVTSTTDADEIKLKLGHGIKKRQILSTMLKQLKTEIEKFPKQKKSTTVRLVNDKVVIANRHELDRFKKVSKKGITYVPVLCIDADYCQEVAKVFLPDIKSIKLSVERNAYITQIYSTTNAKTRFNPRENATKGGIESETAKIHIKNIQGIIDNVCSDYGQALIVGYQDVVGNPKNKIPSKLVLPKGCEYIHFNALRGLNKFGHLATAIIIGRNQLPIDAVESQAAALWWDSDEELVLTGEPCYEERGYRLSSPDKKIGVHVMVCEDNRAQLLQQLQRECESLQAIDRLRLIHNDEIKNVFLLSNVPLDITVDNLVSFTELKNWKTSIEKALMHAPHGILPLGSDYLVQNYPYLFSNASMVKNKVGAAGLAQKIEDIKKSTDLLVFNKKEYNLISFRVEGEKGQNRKVLAPKRMFIGIVKRHLKKIFQNNIEIFEYTKPRHGLDEIKPSDSEDSTEYYHLLPQYYDSVYDVWYVITD